MFSFTLEHDLQSHPGLHHSIETKKLAESSHMFRGRIINLPVFVKLTKKGEKRKQKTQSERVNEISVDFFSERISTLYSYHLYFSIDHLNRKIKIT